MVDGQRAGLCFLGRTYASLDVIREHGSLSFTSDNNGQVIAGPSLSADIKTVWLKADWGTAGDVHFSFSTNGTRFISLGNIFQITSFGGSLGARIGVYTRNDLSDEGYIDLDSFRYDYSR